MEIGFAADHAGFQLKELLKSYLQSKGAYQIRDFGTHSDASTDYPDYAHPLATEVSSGNLGIGIAICGSGEGVCMTANKHPNVRAALVWNEEVGRLSREHNNANILCLPARFIDLEEAKKLVDIFLETDFEGGRHQRRVSKI